jgi:hypothetical protein
MPNTDRVIPSGQGFVGLLQAFRATGGTGPDEVVSRLLEEHQIGNTASLAKLIYTGQVFGFEWRANLWIPMFQFHAGDLALNASAQRVRAELPQPWSGWALASWFASPNAWLDASSPADSLDSDFEAVMHAARAFTPTYSVNDLAFVLPRRQHEASART